MTEKRPEHWFLNYMLTTLIVAALSAFLAVSAVAAFYIYSFGMAPSEDRAVWGQFGDYFGGVLSPILSFITFIVILFTIFMQGKGLQFAIEQLLMSREELKMSRDARAIDLVVEFERKFESHPIREQRRIAAKFLLQYNDVEPRLLDVNDLKWTEVDDVIDFFQGLGTVARFSHMDIEYLYKFFFPWMKNYWLGTRRYIELQRNDDSIVWDDAEWLYNEFCSQEETLNKNARITAPVQDWLDFMIAETNL